MERAILDLYCEFRNLTNGTATVSGNGLLGALAYVGLPAIDGSEEEDMRNLTLTVAKLPPKRPPTGPT